MSTLHRLIYCSRVRISGGRHTLDSEIQRILARSRVNNAAAEIGGALLFSHECFAQVIEGPQDEVAATFERILRDPRHADVTVLGSEPAATRLFPNWGMAYGGNTDDCSDGVLSRLRLDAWLNNHTPDAAQNVLDLLRTAIGTQVTA